MQRRNCNRGIGARGDQGSITSTQVRGKNHRGKKASLSAGGHGGERFRTIFEADGDLSVRGETVRTDT